MISTLPFGSTGHTSTRVLFGAAALGGMSQDRADATMALVESAGVNHIDTAASYGDSELRLTDWLADHRSDVFLASKTGERVGSDARAELEKSLERLGVDQLDLIQLHNLVDEEGWATAHGPGGAVEAMAKARDEGLVRFIGVTGHGIPIAGMHLRSLEAFPFDSVLLPFSPILLRDEGYRADVEALRARCSADGVAVQTIKAIARRRWRDNDDAKKFSWYNPIRDPEVIERAMRYVLSTPDLFLNTTSDATLLPLIFDIANGFDDTIAAPTQAELDEDITAEGITPIFDRDELLSI